MLRRLGCAIVGAMCLLAGVAAADEQIHQGPASPWVKVAPLEAAAAASEADGPFRIVLFDTQARYGPDGDEYYVDRAIQVLSRQGLEAAGTVAQTWHPGTQSLTIHRVEIIRDGAVIDAMATGDPFIALRQETNLAQAMLDGQLTAAKQLEDLRVGDIVRVATTTLYRDPMIRGHSQFAAGIASGGPPIGYLRQRHLWAADKPMRWRAGAAFPKTTLARTADGFELLTEARNVKGPILPAEAPSRFALAGVLILTDFASWKEVSALFAADYAAAATLKPDSPLKAEIETIRRDHATTLDRASAALALVQERVRYLALAMGEGGFKPADADQTWSRKFGDCKGKSALLVALLQELGVEAEVTAVASMGDDGLDQVLPRLAFDHVIVRATIDGKTYWLDPTRQADGAIEGLGPPPYRWVLPVRAGGADLQAIHQVTPAMPEEERVIDADFTAGLDLDAPLTLRVTYRGDAAAYQYAVLSAATRTQAETALKERWSTDNWVMDKAAFGRADDGSVWVEVTGKFRQMWPLKSGRREFQVPYSSIEASFEPREAGSLEPKAPYAIPFPQYGRYVTRLRLPRGGQGFDIIGPDVDIKAAGQWVVRRSRLEDGVAIIEEDDRTTGPEITFAEANSGPARLEAAGATTEVLIRAPAGFRLNAEEADKAVEANPGRGAYMLRATASLTAGDPAKALEDINRILAEDPRDAGALARRAWIARQSRDYDAAFRDWAVLLEDAPQNTAVLLDRGGAYLELGKIDLAQADYDAAVKAAPGQWGPLVSRSVARNMAGDEAGAKADMAEAARLAPDNLSLNEDNIRMQHNGPGDDAARLAALESFYAPRIAAAPADPALYLRRANIRFTYDDRDGAFADFAKAIALKPTPEAYLSRATAYREAGDKGKALADLDAAVKLDAGPRALVARARYNSMEGTPAQWLADARAAVAKAPADLASLEETARAALVVGDLARARESVDDIARVKPADLEVLRLRALVKERAGDLAGAVADMRLAVKGPAGGTLAGKSGRLRLAALLESHAEHAEATAVLTELQKAYPTDAEILGRLCRIKATRDVEAATAPADCDAALALSPDDADYLESLGFAHLRLGRFDRARAAYDEALKIRPGQATSLYGRALAREGAGDLAGAREDARLAARYDRGFLKTLTGYGIVARDEGVIQALAGPPVDEKDVARPKGVVIKLPDWAATATPRYPPRAEAAGREGRIWIRCVVMSGGQLTNCQIENERPQDYEFGDAILKATKDMRMRPMTVDGEPVDGADVRFSSPFLLG